MHNDPVLWEAFARISRECEELRKQTRALTGQSKFPRELGHKADLLAYNLGESRKVALQLAGDKPEEMRRTGGDAA